MLIPLGILGAGSDLNWVSGMSTTAGAAGVAVNPDDSTVTLGYDSTFQLLVKRNNLGQVLWQNSYSATTKLSFRQITSDTASASYATSQVDTTTDYSIFYKVDSTGSLDWQKSIAATSLALDIDSLVIGDSADQVYLSGSIGSNGLICRFTQAGGLTWAKSTTKFGEASRVRLDSSGNVYVLGKTALTGDSSYLAKLDSSGSLTWIREISSPASNFFEMAVSSTGDVYLALTIDGDVILAKFNTSGTLQWNKIATATGNIRADSIVLDASDNLYILGERFITGVVPKGINLFKINSSGSLQWARLISTATASGDAPYDLDIDEQNNLSIAGFLQTPTAKHNLIKYPTDGTITGDFSFSGATLSIASLSITVADQTVTSSTTTATLSNATLTVTDLSNSYSSSSYTDTLTLLN